MKMSRWVFHALSVFTLWLGLGLQAQALADTVTYVYTDPQGTPLVKADAQGNVIARYDYTPYGDSVTPLGSAPDGLGYTGHVSDPETGLVYMQARYYQPFGRFLSPDPAGPTPGNTFSFNRYAYANNNPIRYTDPDGRCSDADGSCGRMVENYGAWANANPEAADKIGSTVGVPAITVMVTATGVGETGGAIALIRAGARYVAGKIVSVAARRSAIKLAEKIPTIGKEGSNGIREVEGSASDAKKMFDTLRGTNKAEEIKPGVSIAKGPNGKTVTYRASSKSGPPTVDVHGVVAGVRKVKFKDISQ